MRLNSLLLSQYHNKPFTLPWEGQHTCWQISGDDEGRVEGQTLSCLQVWQQTKIVLCMFNILLVIFISSDQEQNSTDRTPQQMSGWFTDCWCNWCTSSLSGQHTSKLLAKTTWKVPRTWEDFDPTQILSNSEVWGYSGPQLINGSARWQEVDLNSFYEEEPQPARVQQSALANCHGLAPR